MVMPRHTWSGKAG